MALLYRYVRLNDRARSHVFTFVVTRSVTRDLERDVTSKEFSCGHQRWAITFSRTDKVLGVYLVWKSTSEQVRVYVDFTFTLLNREHFSVNESFTGKQVKFTSDSAAQGNRNYISVNDLYARNFTDANGEFQLELCIGTVRTLFDSEFRIPTSFLGHHIGHRGLHHHGGIATSTLTNIKTPSGTVTKVETSYFSFAGFDWNIALYPHGIKEAHGSNETRLAIYLNRCTGFDHQCRVKYNITLGDTEHTIKSGIMEDVSDSEGKSYGWHPRGKYSDLIRKGVIKIHAELILANTLSELVSNITFQSVPASISGSPNANHGVAASAVVSQCYDRDKQGWTVKCDCHAESIRIHMVYKDVQNVPRNHLRYVTWTTYLIQFLPKPGLVEPLALPGAPFSHYYAQEPTDEGIIMETDVPVKQLREPNCPFITDKNQLRIQIEWGDSYLLFQSTYHKYDDVVRLHNQQMRKEIATLQAENYSLERQLFSYQKSIAFAHSRGTYSDDLTLVDGRTEDEESYFEGGPISHPKQFDDYYAQDDLLHVENSWKANNGASFAMKDSEDSVKDGFPYCRRPSATRRSSISAMFSTLSEYVCSMKSFAASTIKPAQRKFSQIYQV